MLIPGVDQITAFVLLVVRSISFFAIGPLFVHQKVPPQIQALLGVATAVVLYPNAAMVTGSGESTLFGFALLVGREVLLGGLLGLAAAVVFAGIRFAGQLIGIQMGFAIANVFDPAGGPGTPLIGKLQELLAVLLFLLADGHHIFLRALALSTERVPPGGFPELASLPAFLLPMGTSIFVVAVQVGAPVMAALFLTDTAMGFIARAVPQMNIFLVGLPVKIFAGMTFLIASTGLFSSLLRIYSRQIETQMLAILAGM